MKINLLAIGLLLSCWSGALLAMSGQLPPSNDHTGREQCAYYDSGKTEEHGIHYSMQECLSKHDHCDMKCFVYETRCEVQGIRTIIVTQPDGKAERKEETRSYSAQDRDQWRAEDQAQFSCRNDYPRNDYCRTSSCSDVAIRTR